MMPSSSSCAAHSRFLRTLVEREEIRARNMELRATNIDPTLQGVAEYPSYPGMHNGENPQPSQMQVGQTGSPPGATYQYQPAYQSHNLMPAQNGKPNGVGVYSDAFPNSPADALYYDNMCRELGVNRGVDLITNASPSYYPRVPEPQYPMMGH